MVEMLVLIYSGVSSLHMFTYSTYDVTTCVLSIIFSVQVGFFLNIQMESHWKKCRHSHEPSLTGWIKNVGGNWKLLFSRILENWPSKKKTLSLNWRKFIESDLFLQLLLTIQPFLFFLSLQHFHPMSLRCLWTFKYHLPSTYLIEFARWILKYCQSHF